MLASGCVRAHRIDGAEPIDEAKYQEIIVRLQAQQDEANARIGVLREQLDQKNARIRELEATTRPGPDPAQNRR